MTKFSDFIKEIEAEAIAEGPEAVKQLEDLKRAFREKANAAINEIVAKKALRLHRIQIDVVVEANSHQEAVEKVMDFWCPRTGEFDDSYKDSLVLEENEEVCPTCSPEMPRPTLWREYSKKNNKPVY